jgi:hypothetical protein
MEELIKKELIEIVTKYLESENENFEGAVDLVTNFSINHSISPDSLLELSYTCGLSAHYSLTYIFARTCSILSTDNKTKANAHHFAGFASFSLGRNEKAEEQGHDGSKRVLHQHRNQDNPDEDSFFSLQWGSKPFTLNRVHAAPP